MPQCPCPGITEAQPSFVTQSWSSQAGPLCSQVTRILLGLLQFELRAEAPLAHPGHSRRVKTSCRRGSGCWPQNVLNVKAVARV